MRSIQLFFIAILSFSLIQCSNPAKNEQAIPYPDPKPDSLALTFLKGVASSDSVDFNATFSPDGNESV